MDNLHLEILKNLVKCKSVTPHDDGAIDCCSKYLEVLGFVCEKMQFGDVKNLYAKLGNFEKNLCFAGHVDVVPPLGAWEADPFELTEKSVNLYGRGVNDMKGPLASCLAAIHDFVKSALPGISISVLLTSDEEIMGDKGTAKVVEFLKSRNEKITGCILCESCSPDLSGEYIKIGCRGSLNVDFVSNGKQCHVVNAKKYNNHLHDFIYFLNHLASIELDQGNEKFAPSDLEITSIDVANDIRNVVPHKAFAKLNIRFNDEWNFEKLEKFIKDQMPRNIDVIFERFSEAFIGSSEKFTNFLQNSVKKTIGKIPGIGTSGGNSDAVFIKNITDVVEIGSPIANAHIVNEYILSEDLTKLRIVYFNILKDFSSF